MNAIDVVIGRVYEHATFGRVCVLRKTRVGFWLEMRGGITGDKPSIVKGVDSTLLSEVNEPAAYMVSAECYDGARVKYLIEVRIDRAGTRSCVASGLGRSRDYSTNSNCYAIRLFLREHGQRPLEINGHRV